MKRNRPHIVVTAGLIWRQGTLLIAKRPPGSHLAGYWEFPGGKQEKKESLPGCLIREIREEVGLEVAVEKQLLTLRHAYASRSITLHVFQCVVVSGDPEPLEGQELEWVHPSRLRQYRFPPPDLEIIRYLERLKPPS
jgi:mutator protein MutT